MQLRPTELGWKGGLLVASLFVAYFATTYSNLLFLLLSFVVAVGTVGALGALGNLRSVAIALEPPPLAPAGQPRALRLTVDLPRGRQAVGDLTLAIELDGSRHELLHAPVLATGTMVTVTLPALPRGVVDMTAVILRSSHPFGLWCAVRKLPVRIRLVTYPAPAARTAPTWIPLATPSSLHTPSSADAASDEVAGLRPYRHGDSPRSVHWRATARRGIPVVREFAPSAADPAVVHVNRNCPPADLEPQLAAAAAAVLAAERDRRPLELRSQALRLASDGSRRQHEALLGWLAAATPLPPTATEQRHG